MIPLPTLLKVLLNGDMYSCTPIPIDVGDELNKYNDGSFHLHRPTSAMYYELWSKEGWDNECKRVEYLASMGGRQHSYSRPKFQESELKQGYSKKHCEEMLRAAAVKGDMIEATKWRTELMKHL